MSLSSAALRPEKTSGKPSSAWQGVNLRMLAIVLAVGVALWFTPPPTGVEVAAWHLLAIFVTTVLGLILKPLPMGAWTILAITATIVTGVLTTTQALSGFGNSTIWLIVIAFFISRGFIKTGLGSRIAYRFVALLGKRTLGLVYGLVGTDLVLAPAIPSNTARAGGVVYPVARSIAQAYGSDPENRTERKVGSFLTFTIFQGNVITSAMFLTAMAANPLVVKLAGQVGVEISWGLWALAALVPGLISLAVIPALLYRLYPPEIKATPDAVKMAQSKLAEIGPLARNEWIMFAAFVLLLVLWIFGQTLGLDATAAALVGLGLLLLAGVLTWNDVLNESGAWDTLVWFAALVMMASFLNELGFIAWFTETMSGLVGGVNWLVAFGLLSLVYFYSHYLFASNTAHVSAMYAAFLAVAIAVGTPPVLAALVLGFFSSLFSSMTHYGTGPAPIFFGSGYVSMSEWWKLGALISVVNVVIWLGIGTLWWKFLGLW